MSRQKFLSSVLAAAMATTGLAAFSAPAMAADSGAVTMPSTGVYSPSEAAANSLVVRDDSSDQTIYTVSSSSTITMYDGTISIDAINPNQTFYIYLGSDTSGALSITEEGTIVYPRDLGDTELFKMSTDKDGDGKSLIKSITQIANKDFGAGRGTYLKVVLSDTTTTTDLKANATLTFKARKNSSASGVNALGSFNSGDSLTLDMNLWINNSDAGDNPDTGDRVYYDPIANDTNLLVWGDDRAALKFDADSDTSKFYARLSTKNDADLYAQYGDPVNADLWFYDFVSNPTVPSTSRATLTLGIPWDEDDAYMPDPTGCYIYLLDADGYLVDVTDQFTYSEDAEEIPGWSIRTRQLGTYVISDTELDIESALEEDNTVDEEYTYDDTTTTTPDKVIPDTGSADLVNIAVAGAVLSLTAASALVFKKVSK